MVPKSTMDLFFFPFFFFFLKRDDAIDHGNKQRSLIEVFAKTEQIIDFRIQEHYSFPPISVHCTLSFDILRARKLIPATKRSAAMLNGSL